MVKNRRPKIPSNARRFIIVILMIISLFSGYAGGMIGYKIEANTDATSWQIDRSTRNLSFSIDGTLYGTGNFSRYNYIKGISGVDFNEKTSASRGGNLSLEEKMVLKTNEGPVVIKYYLGSSVVQIDENEDDGTDLIINESASIFIDEKWPTYFDDYRRISYIGLGGIRTSDRYNDNGQIISTYSESWRLFKENRYRSLNNRTIIMTDVYPGKIAEFRGSNKSLQYGLRLQSIGSLSRIDVIRGWPSDERTPSVSRDTMTRITQDYRGLVEMKLDISTQESIKLTPYQISEYLPCCIGGYLEMNESDYRWLGSEGIFNCSNINSGRKLP